MKIYIDVVFVTNLLMDYILLQAVGAYLSCCKRQKRTFAGAMIGALFSCLILYVHMDGILTVSILLHGGCACCMTFLAYGLKQKGILAKAILSLYLAAFLAGGLWDMLMRGRKKGFLIFLLFSAVTYFCFMFLAYISQVVDVKKRNLYPVALSYQGKVQSSYGLYDTGNLLTDPISGKPVSVVTPEFLAGLLPGSLAEKVTHLKENPGEIESTELAGLHPHFLICRSVGGERMLLAVTLEDLIIHTPKEVVHIESPVLVLPEEPSALGKECQVLLNAKLL